MCIYIMAGWVADKFWLLIMVLQIDSENSATGYVVICEILAQKNIVSSFFGR